MYIIMTYFDEETQQSEVSHAVNINTGENLILPAEPIEELGYFNANIGEWILHTN